MTWALSITHTHTHTHTIVRIWDVRAFAPADRQLKVFYGAQHNFEKVRVQEELHVCTSTCKCVREMGDDNTYGHVEPTSVLLVSWWKKGCSWIGRQVSHLLSSTFTVTNWSPCLLPPPPSLILFFQHFSSFLSPPPPPPPTPPPPSSPPSSQSTSLLPSYASHECQKFCLHYLREILHTLLFLVHIRFVYVWDSVTGYIIYKLPGHHGSVNDVDFHPKEPIRKSPALTLSIYIYIYFFYHDNGTSCFMHLSSCTFLHV